MKKKAVQEVFLGVRSSVTGLLISVLLSLIFVVIFNMSTVYSASIFSMDYTALGVNNGGVLVENNTFYNLCAVDNKDNNGILHVRSSSAVAPASLGSAARRVLVRKNIFAAMHRASETPSNAAGFPKLVSSASEKIKHPYVTDNLFFDIDTAEPYSWWNTMVAEDIEAAGQVLTETPFEADPATGKFTVKAAYKGYGDTRW